MEKNAVVITPRGIVSSPTLRYSDAGQWKDGRTDYSIENAKYLPDNNFSWEVDAALRLVESVPSQL